MMGWICYLAMRIKASWAKLREAADWQRNYWDAEDDQCL